MVSFNLSISFLKYLMSFSVGKVARLQCLSCKQGLNVKTVQFSRLLSPNWSF